MSSLENRLMTHFSHKTPWTFTTSAGLSAGVSVVGVSGGALYLANASSGEQKTLHYFGGGLSVGLLPASVSLSTASMWSTGVGTIRAASDALTFDDMRGPMCVLSGAISEAEGLSGSMFFLGFPIALALAGGAIEILLSGLTTARAFGVLVGHIQGVDAGVSLLPGYAH